VKDYGRLFQLEGRVVVITGGAGQLGREYAAALSGLGARVAILDLADEAPEELSGIDAPSGRLLYVKGDVTDKASLRRALARITEEFGAPFGLVNNAALDSPPGAPPEENGPFETYPEDSWDRIMEVNTKGVFLCSQVFGEAMAARGRGSIVNICSTYGLVSPDQRLYEYRLAEEGRPFYKPVAYSASKSALLNMTRYLATYFAPGGVRVNTLTLGGVYNGQDRRFVKGYCGRVPLGRMARADEYCGAVIFLMAEASSYMTGSNLIVDGGWTAW
jgi:NAD(P)-dependent dehydrogenase (short-subunit alcohol dehydrogenase family)